MRLPKSHQCIISVFCCPGDNDSVTLDSLLTFWTGADQIPPMGFPTRLKIDFFTREVFNSSYKFYICVVFFDTLCNQYTNKLENDIGFRIPMKQLAYQHP